MKNLATTFQKLSVLFLIALCFGSVQVFGQTSIADNIRQNTVWDISGSPYVIENNIGIAAEDTLQINSGVEVRFKDDTRLSVVGHLAAEGVVFTSDGNSSSGAWRGIIINMTGLVGSNDTGSAVISNSRIEYAAEGAISVEDGTAHITQTQILNSNVALKIGSDAEMVTVSGLTANDNGWPMVLENLKALQISGTLNLTGNSHDGVRVDVTPIEGTGHVLPKLSVPYVFNTTLAIKETGALTIEPENILKFKNGEGLEMGGTLIADGSSGSVPIRITSLKNDNIGGDTNGDGTGSSPSSRDWKGIVFLSTAQDSSMIDNVEISYAGRTFESSGVNTLDLGAITLRGPSPTIQNSAFLNSYAGIVITRPSTPIITGNEFGTSERFPIIMAIDANPTFSNNALSLMDNQYDAIGLIATTLGEDVTITKRNFTDIPNITYVILNDDLVVPDGITLNVEEGVVVKFDNNRIVVKGTLNVNGTETDNVVFTSIHDDSEGNPLDTDKNGNSEVPDERDWGGFVFDTGSDASIMTFADIRYTGEYIRDYDFGGDVGRLNPESAIIISDASPTIANSNISQTDLGISVIRDGSPVIRDNSIFNTKRTPLALSMSANPTLENNEIENTGLRAIGLISETVRLDGTLKRRSIGGFDNITYFMLGDIYIASGVIVNIEAGIVIKAGSNHALLVEGALNASGNETEGLITFTSIKDDNIGNPTDTNNDGNGSAPEAGDWDYLLFRSNTNNQASKIEGADIKFAKSGIVMHSASVPVSNTRITSSGFWGISLDGNSSPTIDNVTIESSNNGPIAISTLADPVFSNIRFNNNGNSGLFIIESRSRQNTGFLESSNLITNDANLAKRTVAGIVGIPYVFGSNMIVLWENTTLTIEPGVILKFNRSSKIRVDGALNAEGTEQERIIFTSIKDDSKGGDTNNDGNASQPTRDDWSGIKFNDSSIEEENVLKYVTMGYARSGDSENRDERDKIKAIDFENSSGLIEDVTLELIGHDAISIRGNSDPVIRNTQFLNVNGLPVSMDMFATPVFENNSMSNTNRAIGIFGETWTNNATVPIRNFGGFENITYQLLGDITIGPGTTIVIPAGLVFKSTNPSFEVDGKLEVLGTDANPVVFTHLKDDMFGNPKDTRNNGPATGGSEFPGNWIKFNSGSNDESIVDNAIFRKRARSGQPVNYSGIFLDNASPTIKNSRFESNTNGVFMDGLSEPVLKDNIFNDNRLPIAGSILSFPSVASGNRITGSSFRAIGIKNETLVQNFTLPRRSFAGINGIPYYFKNNYTIGSGVVLTIDPGVIMKFRGGSTRLNVKKGLIAEGTPDSMIVFTAIEDDFYGGDTNADSSSSSPTGQIRQWKGIHFESESLPEFSKLDHVVVRYAATGSRDDDRDFAGININNASPMITNSIIQRNRYGIRATGSSNPVINNNDIFDNLEYGVRNVDQTFTIDATNNWWGNNSGPTADGNPEGTGDRVSEGVSFMPFEGGGAANPQLGDVALNGRIMAYDASVVLKSLVGLETLSEAQQRAADVSGDGTVAAMDASYILQFVVNLIQNFPADMRTKGKTPEPLAEVSDIDLYLGSPDVREDGVTAIPVYMDNIENLLSFSIHMEGLKEGYQFIGAEKSDLLSEASLQVNADGSHLKSAMASTDMISGSGVVMTLLFEAVNPDQDKELDLNPVQFIANETDMTGLVTSTDETDLQQPEEFALQQNYPNPFNPSTTIRFDLPARADVTLEVYNMIGQRVAQLAGGDSYNAGSHTLTFDASGLASGMYIYRIQAINTDAGDSEFLQTRKMMLIK